MQTYETALNASDTDTVLSVFASDSVFIAPNSPSTVGADAIRAAYNGIFKAITFDTELTVEEVVQVAPDWAFARTSSNGHVTVNAIKQRVPDANHELFLSSKKATTRGRSRATPSRRRTPCPSDWVAPCTERRARDDLRVSSRAVRLLVVAGL